MSPRRQYRLLQVAFLFALVGCAFWGSYAGMYPHERAAAENAARHDNSVQESATVWSWLMSSPESAAAIILCFITAILAVATFGLYWKTAALARDAKETGDSQREQMAASIREAGAAARAMAEVARHIETSANTGIEILANSKKFASQQLRAYLSVIIGGAIFQDGQGLKFQGSPRIVNNGATPAYRVRFAVKAQILSRDEAASFVFSEPAAPAESQSNIGAREFRDIHGVVPDLMPESEVATIKEGVERALWVWGVVHYEDCFGEPHFTQFCQRLFWNPEDTVFGMYDGRFGRST